MMRKAVLTLVAKVYCDWLSDELPPSGRPKTCFLLGYVIHLINVLPPGTGPDNVGSPGSMTEENLKNALEWIWSMLSESLATNEWAQLAVQVLRIEGLEHLKEIHSRIIQPRSTLDSRDHAALKS